MNWMTPPPFAGLKRLFFPCLFAVCTFSTTQLHADEFWFRPESGGGNPVAATYQWNTTSPFWYTALTGGSASSWDNDGIHDARLVTSAAYTLALAEDINVRGIYKTGNGHAVTITSHDVDNLSTLNFLAGGLMSYQGNRGITLQNIKINGSFEVTNGNQSAVTIGTGVLLLNTPTITVEGTGTLNLQNTLADSPVEVVLTGGRIAVSANARINRLSGSGSIRQGTGGTLTVQQNTHSTLSGYLGTDGTGNNGFHFTKSGTGTLIINSKADHRIIGTITADAGALFIDGQLSNTSNSVIVAGGATFGGGLASSKLITLSAANSRLVAGMASQDENGDILFHAAQLTLGNGLTATNGGIFDFFLDDTDTEGALLNSQILSTNGTLNLGGTKTVNLYGLGSGLLQGGVTYTLFNATGASPLSEDGWVLGLNTTGLEISSFGVVGNQLQVMFEPIPEPGTSLLLLGGLLGFVGYRFNRRRP